MQNTFQAIAILAQNRLLQHYVKNKYEVKYAYSSNYIIIQGINKNKILRYNYVINCKYNILYYLGKLNKYQPIKKRKERVLLLMHGYGLGLGCFYGNIL